MVTGEIEVVVTEGVEAVAVILVEVPLLVGSEEDLVVDRPADSAEEGLQVADAQ